MPACMLISRSTDLSDKVQTSCLEKSINKAGRLLTRNSETSKTFAAISYTAHCRLGKSRLYSDEHVCAWFNGFLVDFPDIPWTMLLDALKAKQYHIFKSLKAPFALAAHFYHSGETFLVSDICSQLPVYYCLREDRLLMSTSLATFFDCASPIRFDAKWLTDFIFFNFPIAQTTPIAGVFRMPAASVLHLGAGKNTPEPVAYADVYRHDAQNCSKTDVKEKTHDLFQQRFPKYYSSLSEGPYAASITAGFDSRLCVLYAPEHIDLHLYTYGIPGCADMLMGKQIAAKLGKPHHEFAFEGNGIEALSELAETAVDYTGGSLNVMRSTLISVYEQLAERGFEAVITGIVGDHFFRNDELPGANMSIAATELFRNPAYRLQDNILLNIFQDKQKAIEHFEESRTSLEQNFSWSDLPAQERQLTFTMYELSAKYFGGEAALAEHYVAMASPFWDADIKKNAYNNALSTICLSKYIHGRDLYWKRHALFASILMRHPQFKNIPINGLSPQYYAAGNKYYFFGGKIIQRSLSKISKIFFPRANVPQERWDQWVGKYILTPLLKSSENLRISEYIAADELKKIIASESGEFPSGSNYFIAGKLATAEFLLRKFT